MHATVIKQKGPVSYLVQKGQRWLNVHVDHMLPRNAAEGSTMHGVLWIPNASVMDDNKGPLIFPTVGNSSMPVIKLESPENTENLAGKD